MADRLNVICGTTRPGRAGIAVARWAADQARTHGGFDVEFVDLDDFDLPLLDEPNHPRLRRYQHDHTQRWSASVDAADAYLFVTPEYDYFPSAALINAVQCLSAEWAYKAAAVVSYGGISGGLRAAQEFMQLLGNVNVMAIVQTVPIAFFSKFIDDGGVFQPDKPIADGLALALSELAKWTNALKPLRTP